MAYAGDLALRLRVWTRALELDRRLAEGTRPACSPELSLRARQLTSARSRDALSGCLTAAVDTAAHPWLRTSSAAPLAADAVLEAAGTLLMVAYDLRTISDPPVAAVALVSWLVCDGGSSPLYNRQSPVSVREIGRRARAALGRGDESPVVARWDVHPIPS